MQTKTAELAKQTAIVVAILLVPVLIWFLFDVVLIIVGAILTAVLLWTGADPFIRYCKLRESLALALSGLIVLGVIVGIGYIFGAQIGSELGDVLNRAQAAQHNVMSALHGSGWGRFLLAHVQSDKFSISSFVDNAFTISSRVLEAIVVALISGIYIAIQPLLYRDGLIQLFPKRSRANARETFDDLAHALRLWLLGQLIQMLIVGALSMLAAWCIGLPSPLALGLIAGAAEFIPYLGPILASIPALLVAATKDSHAVLWTLVAYVLIHQTEGNLIVPLVQRHLVFIPPAVMLLGLVTLSFLFGIVAMIFAAPIAVILFVSVKKLYLRDSLGERTPIPGEPRGR